MGVDLSGTGGSFRWAGMSWGKVLSLAQMYGWKPAGTTLPIAYTEDKSLIDKLGEWDGNYFYNAYQGVTDSDALAFALALEAALDDIPDSADGIDQWITARKLPDGDFLSTVLQALPHDPNQMVAFSGPNEKLNPLEFFAGTEKAYLREFIAYCRKGGFVIG